VEGAEVTELDNKVADWLLGKYRAEYPQDHLGTCPEATTKNAEGWDGQYGCETGCEYLRLECTVTCPHGQSAEYDYGDFGSLDLLLDDLTRSIDDPGRLFK